MSHCALINDLDRAATIKIRQIVVRQYTRSASQRKSRMPERSQQFTTSPFQTPFNCTSTLVVSDTAQWQRTM